MFLLLVLAIIALKYLVNSMGGEGAFKDITLFLIKLFISLLILTIIIICLLYLIIF